MVDEKNLSEKISGKCRRPENAGGKRVLEGRCLLSPVDQGRIASISLPPEVNGLSCILSREVPGSLKTMIGGVSFPLFTSRNILWKGQPILAAAGGDPDQLDEWLNSVTVDIRPVDTEPLVSESTKTFEKGSLTEGFAKAFQIVEDTLVIPPTSVKPWPNSVTCMREGNRYLIHTATSWPGMVRKTVSRALGISRNNVGVRPYSIGSESNAVSAMWRPAMDAGRAALLAWKTKRSVRINTAVTSIESNGNRSPGAEFSIRGAVDSEGRILAMEADFTIICGFALPLEEETLKRVALGLFSVYPCRHYSVTGRIRKNPGPPSTPGPAAGFELGFLAGELFASRVSEASSTAPGQLRRKILSASRRTFGSGLTTPKDYAMTSIMDNVLNLSDFERKNAAYDQTRLSRQRLEEMPKYFGGIGLGCGWFGNGFMIHNKDLTPASLVVTLGINGELTIEIPPHPACSDIRQAWLDLAANILGINKKSIRFTTELPISPVEPGPAILGRNVTTYTHLLELACHDLAKRRFRDALPITVSKVWRRTTKSEENDLNGTPFEAISWGVGVVEVELSTRTGIVRPTRIWLMVDGGTLLMPHAAKAAVESATERTLAWCLGQEFNSENSLIEVMFHDPAGKRPPKDVSSIPWTLIPAALMQAVRQAAGSTAIQIPMNPVLLAQGDPPE